MRSLSFGAREARHLAPLSAALAAALVLWLAGCGNRLGPDTQKGGSPAARACDPNVVPFGGGAGTESDPYRVCSRAQWASMAEDTLGKNFVLGGDIDFENQSAPLIEDFQGTLDGDGKSLRHLGGRTLFSKLSGTVRNLRIVDVALIGGLNVGAVAGIVASSGLVEDVFVSGSIVGTFNVGSVAGASDGVFRRVDAEANVQGTQKVGGLVGILNGQMQRCYARGGVSGSQVVGGLAGSLALSGSIREAMVGPITLASSVSSVGGIAGETGADTIVEDVVVLANVTGAQNVGGAVGAHVGTMMRVLAAGTVVASGEAPDPLCGDSLGASIASYFDETKSGLSASACGNGETTDDLYLAATYAGWDVVNRWLVNGSGYPSLR